MKLYEISDQIRQALEMVANGDIPEDQMADTLDALGIEFDAKVDNTAAVIRELSAESESLKGEIERLQNLKRVRDGHVESLKDYIRLEMNKAGKKKIEGKRFNVTLGAATETVAISGEVPDQYMVIKKSEDKSLIKRELKSGKQIAGAQLVQGKEKLIIK